MVIYFIEKCGDRFLVRRTRQKKSGSFISRLVGTAASLEEARRFVPEDFSAASPEDGDSSSIVEIWSDGPL
jgi:hypothetical protein